LDGILFARGIFRHFFSKSALAAMALLPGVLAPNLAAIPMAMAQDIPICDEIITEDCVPGDEPVEECDPLDLETVCEEEPVEECDESDPDSVCEDEPVEECDESDPDSVCEDEPVEECDPLDLETVCEEEPPCDELDPEATCEEEPEEPVDPCLAVTGPWATTLTMSAPSTLLWGEQASAAISMGIVPHDELPECTPQTLAGTVLFHADGEDVGEFDLATLAEGETGFTFDLPPFQNAGTHTITATYQGHDDDNGAYFMGADDSAVLDVDKAHTRMEVRVVPNVETLRYLENHPEDLPDISIHVLRDPDPIGGIPSGDITIRVGPETLIPRAIGPGTENPDGFIALSKEVLNTALRAAQGLNSVTFQAEFSGGADDYPADQISKTFLISSNSSSMTLSASPEIAPANGTIELTVELSGSDSIPSGAVISFTYDENMPLGEAYTDANGIATYNAIGLPPGPHTIFASFAGGTGIAGSGAQVDVLVGGVPTNITLGAVPINIVPGGSSTLTASISSDPELDDYPIEGSIEFREDGVEIASVPLVNGYASLPLSNIPEGVHSYTAHFDGSLIYAASDSAPARVGAGKRVTETTISPSSQIISSGDTASFTANVSVPGSDAIPTGTIDFLSGATVLESASLQGDGNVSVSFVPPDGFHSIIARYSGDGQNEPSQSDASSLQVGSLPVTLSLLLSPSSPTVADTINVVASLNSSGIDSPTGTIQFSLNGDELGEPYTVSVGMAQITLPALPAGNHVLEAFYSGDTGYDPASKRNDFTVTKQATSTFLSANLNDLQPGDSLPLSILVQPQTASGTVSIYSNGSVLVDEVTLVGGEASYELTDLHEGLLYLHAVYNGDEDYANSSSTPIQTVIGRVSTSLGAVRTADPAPVGSDNVIMVTIAHNDPLNREPTGQVVFRIGEDETSVPLTGGTAEFSVAHLPVGAHSIEMSYSGDTYFKPSNNTILQRISKLNSTLSITPSVPNAIAGSPVTFSVALSPIPPRSELPTGDVELQIDAREFGPITLVDGEASFEISGIAAGSYSIVANYLGDLDFDAKSGSIGYTFTHANSVTTLTSSKNPSAVDETVSFTATVNSDYGTPEGDVRFSVGSETHTATLTDGVASLAWSGSEDGTVGVFAQYMGSPYHFDSVSSSLDQQVGTASASISLDAAAGPLMVGDRLDVTATVSPSGSATGTPTGIVRFSLDGAEEFDAVLDSNGVATWQTPTLTAGTRSISASYLGDGVFTPVVGTITRQVNRLATTTVLTITPNPSDLGEEVDLLVEVSSSTGTPTGSVDVLIGGTPITISLLDGKGNYTWLPSNAGSREIVATYTGSPVYATSNSLVVQHMTNPATAKGHVNLDVTAPASISYGQTGEIIGAITPIPPAIGTPTGTMTLLINGLENQTLPVLGTAVSFTAPILDVGVHAVAVRYNGDDQFLSAVSDSTLILVANTAAQIATSTAVTAAPAPAQPGSTTALTATVTPASGSISAGSVDFFVNGTAIGSIPAQSGPVSIPWSASATGNYSVVAVYSGHEDFLPSISSPYLLTVSEPSVDRLASVVTATPSSIVIDEGTNTSISVQVASSVPSSETPQGIISVSIDNGPSSIFPLAGAEATIPLLSLPIGMHSVAIDYIGDATFLGSSTSVDILVQVVGGAVTTNTSLSVIPAIINPGQTTTFTAGVTAADEGVPNGSVAFLVDGTEIVSLPLSNGVVSTSYTPSTVGEFDVVAVYSGTPGTYLGSSSTASVLSVTDSPIGRTPTSTTLSSSGTEYITGDQAIISILVSAADNGTPSGTVSVRFDSENEVVLPLVDGAATYTTPALTLGQHSITASYSGDDDFLDSAASVLFVTASDPLPAAVTTTTLSLTPVNGSVGQTTTLQAHIVAENSDTVDAGSVDFQVDGVSVGSVAVTNGVVTLDWMPTTDGTHSVQAVYTGAPGLFHDSTSSTADYFVLPEGSSKANTVTTVTTTAGTIPAGSTATIAIAVEPQAPATGMPTGSVQVVMDGGTPVVLGLIDGETSWETSALAVGTHEFVVSYLGDNDFLPSNGSTQVVVEAGAGESPTTTQILASPVPGVAGAPTTFTARVVSPDVPLVNGGTINFHIDGQPVATNVEVVNGEAITIWVPASDASYVVQALYSGLDGVFSPSTSIAGSYTVGTPEPQKIDTSTAATPSSTTTEPGETVSIDVVVSPIGQPGTPTGLVRIVMDGGAPEDILLTGGTATWTTPALVSGSHVVTISYLGDGDFNASTAPAIDILVQEPSSTISTTTNVLATPYPGVIAQETTFTAQIVASDASPVDIGTATFNLDGVEIAVVPVSNGTASTTWTPTEAMSHVISVSYSGGDNMLPSASTDRLYPVDAGTAERSPTTITATSTSATVNTGDSISLSITVSDASSEGNTPTGSVIISQDGAEVATIPLTAGQLTWVSAPLSSGQHSFTAYYMGDTDFLPSMSTQVDIVASGADLVTVTTLNASPTPGIVGEPVVLTATITSDSTVSNGSVEFIVDGQPVGTSGVFNGVATLTWVPALEGTHSVQANYGGHAGLFAPSVSPAVDHEVEQPTVPLIATTTALAALPYPGVTGTQAVFTATVSAADASNVNAGSVVFSWNGTEFATVAVNNGTATATRTPDAAGNYSVEARYQGAPGIYAPSSYNGTYAVDDPVIKATTTTIATASASEVAVGQSVGVAISVVSGNGEPSGQVSVILDDDTPVLLSLVDGGVSWTTPALSEGNHAITVSYIGDDDFLPSSAAPVMVLATTTPSNTVQTSTVLSLMPSNGQVGQPSTFTALVSTPNGTPASGGDISFAADGTVIATVPVQNGVATTVWTPTQARDHEITAFYSGVTDTYSTSSASSSYPVSAPSSERTSTTTSISADRNSIQAGESVQLDIHVLSAEAGTPDGNVALLLNGNRVATLTLSAGSATWTSPSLAAGTYAITASYEGNNDFLPSAALPIVIVSSDTGAAVETSVSLLMTPTSSTSGDTISLLAQVTSSGTLVNGGTLAFIVDGQVLATTPVVNGIANASWTAGIPGDHTITAMFSGVIGTYLPSTTQAVHVVQPADGSGLPTTTSLNLPSTPIPFSSSISIDANVSAFSGTPSGTVEFFVDNVSIGSSAIGSNGLASIPWITPATPGSVSIRAHYSGSGVHEPSTASGIVEISSQPATGRPSTVHVEVSPNPATTGERAAILVDVRPVAPDTTTPSGQVTISLGALGSLQGTLINGQVSFQTSTLPSGSYPIVASYSGDDIHNPNTSTPLLLAVNAGTGLEATSTSLSVSPSDIDLGDTVSLVATVTSMGLNTPTGTVEFRAGETVIGTASLSSGEASLSWIPTTTGYQNVSAHYQGDAGHDPSSSASHTVMVRHVDGAMDDSVISLTMAPDPAYAGQTTVFTATVSPVAPSVGMPTGNVTFSLDGIDTTVSLVNGRAAFASPAMLTGRHEIMAVYHGDTLFSPSTTPLRAFQVLEPGMTPTTGVLTASIDPAAIGQVVVYDLTVTAQNGSTPAGNAVLVIDGVDQQTVALVNGRATWTRKYDASGQYQVGVLYMGTATHAPSSSNVLVQTVSEQQMPGSITIRQVAGNRDANFTFSSDAPGLSGTIRTHDGRGQIGPVEIQPGRYTIMTRDPSEAGYVLSMINCTDPNAAIDVLARTAIVDVAPGESVICTFSSTDATTETVESIQNFLDARADVLIANIPGIDRRIDRLKDSMSGAAFNPGAFLMGYTSVFEETAPMRFSTSLSAIDSVMGRQQPNQFDVWAEGAFGTMQRGAAGDGLYGIVSVGADYRVDRNMLVGVMGQYDHMALDQGSGVKIEGNGWMVGPYMTMRIGEGVYLDLMALTGASNNTVSPYGTYTDNFDTRRNLVNATLQGDWDMGGWTFEPRARATYFDETSESYVDSRGIRIPEVSTHKGSLSIGPGASYAFSLDALEVEVGARVEAAADISNANGTLGLTNTRGRLEGTIDIGLPGGAGFDLTLMYDGLGSTNGTIGARAGLLVPLD